MSVASKEIPVRDRLIFAMDVPDCDQARELAIELDDSVAYYKLGLELMMTGGYFELLDWMLARNKKVFADLKFYDIPATVAGAIKGLRSRGVNFVTVHGNRSIMEAAASHKGDDMKVLAVTVLTSLDRADLHELGHDCDVGELVLSRAKLAYETGCDGVISSGLEVARLREHIDPELLVVTPGIRPDSSDDKKSAGDQKRVVSASQAIASGADYIVVGRPIRDAANPRQAAESLQSEIQAAVVEGAATT